MLRHVHYVFEGRGRGTRFKRPAEITVAAVELEVDENTSIKIGRGSSRVPRAMSDGRESELAVFNDPSPTLGAERSVNNGVDSVAIEL